MIRIDDILEKVSYYSEKDATLLKKAYVFAAQAHKGQVRRSGEPYLSHPLEVTSMLADLGLDKTTLAAGLLHDVLEDTDVTAEELQKAFGKDIAHLVEGVTKISRVQEASPETRQAETIRKIILAMTDDLRVIFIKLADRIHNLKTLKFLPEFKQQQVARETLEIYAPIANRLGMGRIKAELEDLAFRYVDPENYFRMASLVEPQKKKAEREIRRVRKKLALLLKENHIPAEANYRIKRLYSVYNKMKRQKIDFDQVYDFLALRLITDTEKNCYAILGIIHQHWPYLPHRFRDFISMPKPNLYKALHTTILTEKKQTIEIQIRTKEMHNLAINGIAAHWKYKEPDSKPDIKEDRRLHWLREMVDLYREQKSPGKFLKDLKTDLLPEEVYLFTPKGKIIALPSGATALDFAFKIHSEIGLHASGARINSKEAPLKTILHAGDIVEILTAPEKKPSRDWLNTVITSSARHQIKRWLNLQDRIKNTVLGKKLWERELKKYKLPPGAVRERALLKRLSQELTFRIKTLDDFYALIGFGKVVLSQKFIEKLFPEAKIEAPKKSLLGIVTTMVSKKPQPAILVKGTEEALVKLAKCCHPIKGEPITGYITSGKGVTVHSLRCPLVNKEILDPTRMVEASWDEASKGSYLGKLLIESQDSPGVLARLATIIAEEEGNIAKIQATTHSNSHAQIRLTLSIRNIQHLDSIIKRLSGIKEIFFVERI